MKIGDLAELVGIAVETIRFYEQKGLMPPPARTSGNFRNYSQEHVERLTLIRHCRALDMSHEEIQVLLECVDMPEGPCLRVNTVVDDHIVHVASRIADLKALERTLLELRSRCDETSVVSNCGILHGLADLRVGPGGRDKSHTKLAHN